MKQRKFVILFAILALPLTAGCSSLLAPRPDPTKFYVLTAVAGAADTTSPVPAAAHQLAIGLGPVTLPDYLGHLEVVTRVSPNRIELSPTDQWAEPLDESFRHILALNLATLLGTDRVMPFPWDASAKLDYRIAVTVQRFERDGAGGTQLVADWLIRGGTDEKTLLSRQSTFSENAGTETGTAAQTGVTGSSMDYAAAALSADLSDLSKQIADAVTALNSVRPSSATN
jgi:uncharacterized protein